MGFWEELLGVPTRPAARGAGALTLARPPDKVYRIQAQMPVQGGVLAQPPDRVYRLQAQMPVPAEPPTIMIPGVGAVVPPQYRIPENERPPRETIIQLPRREQIPEHERLPKEVVIQLPKKKKR